MHRIVTPNEGIGIIVEFCDKNSQIAILLKGLGYGKRGYDNAPEVPPW